MVWFWQLVSTGVVVSSGGVTLTPSTKTWGVWCVCVCLCVSVLGWCSLSSNRHVHSHAWQILKVPGTRIIIDKNGGNICELVIMFDIARDPGSIPGGRDRVHFCCLLPSLPAASNAHATLPTYGTNDGRFCPGFSIPSWSRGMGLKYNVSCRWPGAAAQKAYQDRTTMYMYVARNVSHRFPLWALEAEGMASQKRRAAHLQRVPAWLADSALWNGLKRRATGLGRRVSRTKWGEGGLRRRQ